MNNLAMEKKNEENEIKNEKWREEREIIPSGIQRFNIYFVSLSDNAHHIPSSSLYGNTIMWPLNRKHLWLNVVKMKMMKWKNKNEAHPW